MEHVSEDKLADTAAVRVDKPKTLIPKYASIAAGVIVLAGVSFYSGVAYQKGKPAAGSTTKTAYAANGQNGQYGGMGGFAKGSMRGSRSFGTISAISSSSITVSSRRGGSETYTITSSTTVTNNGSSAAVSDIQTGDTVMLTLDASNTKNVTAIALNPSFGDGPGGGSDGAPTASSDSLDSSGSSST